MVWSLKARILLSSNLYYTLPNICVKVVQGWIPDLTFKELDLRRLDSNSCKNCWIIIWKSGTFYKVQKQVMTITILLILWICHNHVLNLIRKNIKTSQSKQVEILPRNWLFPVPVKRRNIGDLNAVECPLALVNQ